MCRGLLLAGVAALVLAASPAADVTPLDRDLLREINTVRAAHARPPLRLDPVLQRAAEAHSADMVARDYFAHGDFAARMRRFRARGPLLGENLAWGSGPYTSAQAIVRLWLGSPGHRANLLRANFQRAGVAAVTGRFSGVAGAVVVTVDFAGDPRATPTTRPPSGRANPPASPAVGRPALPARAE